MQTATVLNCGWQTTRRHPIFGSHHIWTWVIRGGCGPLHPSWQRSTSTVGQRIIIKLSGPSSLSPPAHEWSTTTWIISSRAPQNRGSRSISHQTFLRVKMMGITVRGEAKKKERVQRSIKPIIRPTISESCPKR